MQGLATAREIFATATVVGDARASGLLGESGLVPVSQPTALRGIAGAVDIFAIPG